MSFFTHEGLTIPYISLDNSSDLPKSVLTRVNYLWESAFRWMSSDQPSLARHYVSSLRSILRQYRAGLAEEITEWTCPFCPSLLIPQQSCQVQLKPVSGNAMVNRKRKRQDLPRVIQNLHLKCRFCTQTSVRSGIFSQTAKASTSTRRNEAKPKKPSKAAKIANFTASFVPLSSSASKPRKLLDSPPKKKKKKQNPAPASTLNTFLRNLQQRQ